MAGKAHKLGNWALVVLGLVLLVLVVGLLLLQPTIPLFFFLHAAALLGYLLIFFSSLSSAYLRQLVRWFGRPFIQVHHIIAVSGLAMIALHPILAAIAFADPGMFIPSFGSASLFFRNGGRLAWYLLAAASLAALFRKAIGKNWRFAHWLTYITFWLGTIHALLIGPNVQNLPMRIIFVVLALVLVYVLVKRRMPLKAAPKVRRGASA